MHKKTLFIISLALMLTTIEANAEETNTYSQPPAETGEFIVEQADQKELANLEKDTDQIEVTSDFMGLKKFTQDTFNKQKIKDRYRESLRKLKEDKSSFRQD